MSRIQEQSSGSNVALRSTQLVRNLPAMQDTRFASWVRKIPWKRGRLPTPVFLGFPCNSAGKESACSAGDLGLIPGLGRSLREGKGYPLQYSGLENSMDCIVHGVAKSQTWLSDFDKVTSEELSFRTVGSMAFVSKHKLFLPFKIFYFFLY